MALAAAFTAALVMGSVARAQSESATVPPPDAPARVGRISLISGPVTLTDYRENEESDATLNWPITSQQRLSTGRVGRVEVRIGSTSVRLDGDTVLDFNRIDDEVMQLTLQRGTVAIRVRSRDHLREIDFLTPRERIVLEDVGRYRIDVDRADGVSAVTAHVGTARVLSGRLNFVVQSGQRGETSAAHASGFQLVSASPDVFDDWVAARDRRDDTVQSTRYVNPETTGIESLDDHGEWRTVESYGAVWFPRGVVAGWAPYRYGRWTYIAPWGWTWIDDASWGFTPFHYGRWVYVHNSWGWVPGAYVARPCYAPALVAWYGTPGVSVSIGFGSPVGWFPLGPGEIYIPGYHYSRRYITFINYGHVTNINQIVVINPPPHYRYRQPNFSTWAPRDALVRRTPINRVVQPAPNDWAKLPTVHRPPAKVTEELRQSKRELVKAPSAAPGPGMPAVRRPNGAARIDPPGHTPATRVNPIERDANAGTPGRPPLTKVTPPNQELRVAPPAQRPSIGQPRVDSPRQDAPRSETIAPPRPPKVQPGAAATPPAGQIASPRPQPAPRPVPRVETPPPVAAPRPMPRPEPPPQAIVPRPVPRAAPPPPAVAPRPSPPPAPVQRVAPPQRPSGAEMGRPKVPGGAQSQRH